MDFAAQPLVTEESIASRSNIVFIPTSASKAEERKNGDASEKDHDEQQEEKSLDDMVIEAANQAAIELLLGSTEKPDPKLVDARLYKEHSLNTQTTIQPGSLVVIMESFDKLNFVYVETGAIFNNRNGHFHHDDFMGKPFGCKIRSRNNRGYGFCYLLKPTPELWCRSLNHRTQIVHELDQAQVIFQLQLRPNMVVLESGTGSGAMSHAILRTIAPHGRLHTYEFNQVRAETARKEFSKNGVDHLVQVHHKDVCGKNSLGGFDLPGQSVDAAFLDLPEPWLAVPHAAFVLKPNARIATYSPCVEQTQRTVQALAQHGFHSCKTMEYRLQEHYVDQVDYESPPRAKRQRPEQHDHAAYAKNKNDTAAAEAARGSVEEDTGGEDENEKSGVSETEAVVADKASDPSVNKSKTSTTTMGKRKEFLVARPFVNMRGHTAFLTFATAGIEPRPDPNADQAKSDTS